MRNWMLSALANAIWLFKFTISLYMADWLKLLAPVVRPFRIFFCCNKQIAGVCFNRTAFLWSSSKRVDELQISGLMLCGLAMYRFNFSYTIQCCWCGSDNWTFSLLNSTGYCYSVEYFLRLHILKAVRSFGSTTFASAAIQIQQCHCHRYMCKAPHNNKKKHVAFCVMIVYWCHIW